MNIIRNLPLRVVLHAYSQTKYPWGTDDRTLNLVRQSAFLNHVRNKRHSVPRTKPKRRK